MAQTTARIKKAGMKFEILVDLDDAMKVRKGDLKSIVPEGDRVFKDVKKGEVASPSDLEHAFNTQDVNEIAKIIVKNGEVQTTQEYRSAEQEAKYKQVVDFLVTNAIDPQTKNPISPERIKSALKDAHVNVKNTSIETQIPDIMSQLSKIIPIKLETKRVRVTIPAIHTGRAYGVIAQYKEREDWLNDGSLEVVVSVPSGMIMDFYDKLNSTTQGSALTEEIKEE